MFRLIGNAVLIFFILAQVATNATAALLSETESNDSTATAQFIADSAFTINSSLRHPYRDAQSRIFDFNFIPTAQVVGSFLGLADKDFYSINGRAGERFFVEVTGRTALTAANGNNDSALYLHDGAGKALYIITTDHEPVINDFILPADGIYYLQLHTTTLDNRPKSDYLLEVSRLPADPNTVPEAGTLFLIGIGLLAMRRSRGIKNYSRFANI